MEPSGQDLTTQLLGQARRQPRDGFAALHAHLQAPLRLWAELHLRAPLRQILPPDDFVQEVWARAYAAFFAYDHTRTNFRAWLFGIAYNVLREQLRTLHRRRPRESSVDGEFDVADPATTLRTGVDRRDRARELLVHAEALNEDDRRLLVWRGLEGLSFATIGDRLQIQAAAADSRWRRLCDRLRGAFPEWIER